MLHSCTFVLLFVAAGDAPPPPATIVPSDHPGHQRSFKLQQPSTWTGSQSNAPTCCEHVDFAVKIPAIKDFDIAWRRVLDNDSCQAICCLPTESSHAQFCDCIVWEFDATHRTDDVDSLRGTLVDSFGQTSFAARAKSQRGALALLQAALASALLGAFALAALLERSARMASQRQTLSSTA